jgi:hypothetical protein
VEQCCFASDSSGLYKHQLSRPRWSEYDPNMSTCCFALFVFNGASNVAGVKNSQRFLQEIAGVSRTGSVLLDEVILKAQTPIQLTLTPCVCDCAAYKYTMHFHDLQAFLRLVSETLCFCGQHNHNLLHHFQMVAFLSHS